MRELMDRAKRGLLIKRAGVRCNVCGFSQEAALRIHHKVPVEFGGRDARNNLIVICGNCHSLAHHLGTKSAVRAKDALSRTLGQSQRVKLLHLGAHIREARRRRKTHRMSLNAAIQMLARLNKLDEPAKRVLGMGVERVVAAIPSEVRRVCAYRLIRNGRAFTINLMNYCLFRTPAFSDMGSVSGTNDGCFLAWPREARPSLLKRLPEGRIAFEFQTKGAEGLINLWLSRGEIVRLKPADW